MGTRSSISVQHTDGSISEVYCHWDGYVEHNGKLLVTHYNTQERAEALVALGDISALNKSIECPAGHSFNTPAEGCTIFYGRDRGEGGTQAKKYKNAKAWLVFLIADYIWDSAA